MKKRVSLSVVFAAMLAPLAAQTLTLEQCQQLVRENYPS